MDAISLSVFADYINVASGEMGVALQKSAFSLNIRDCLDHSCVILMLLENYVRRPLISWRIWYLPCVMLSA